MSKFSYTDDNLDGLEVVVDGKTIPLKELPKESPAKDAK